jgi:hypothetical protein
MHRTTLSSTRAAFTLLESLLMLVILSIWCVVTFAVVKAKMRTPVPTPTVASPQVVPLESVIRESPASVTSGKAPNDGLQKEKSAAQGN